MEHLQIIAQKPHKRTGGETQCPRHHQYHKLLSLMRSLISEQTEEEKGTTTYEV